MKQVAATLAAAGQPKGFHRAAAEAFSAYAARAAASARRG
jgi:hypothetical protein